MPRAPRISPPVTVGAGDALKQVVDAELAQAALPPDVLGSWHHFATAIGLSVPGSINRATAHRRAFRQAVK